MQAATSYDVENLGFKINALKSATERQTEILLRIANSLEKCEAGIEKLADCMVFIADHIANN